MFCRQNKVKPIWAIISCPIYGYIGEILREQVQQFPDPWKSHALVTLDLEMLTAMRTHIIVGIDEGRGLVGSVWISLPDKVMLSGWKTSAFIFHIHVPSRYRGYGLGKRVVRLACSAVKRYGADSILLATSKLALKRTFYKRLGFVSLVDDPWLMSYKIQKATRKEERSAPSAGGEIVRSVSPHDLATVQSVCAQKHWVSNNDAVSIAGATECEEEFSTLFVNGHAFKQFLVRGRYGEKEFASWLIINENGELTQHILCDNVKKEDIRKLSADLGSRMRSFA